jgi:hypothetical protein
VRIPSLQPLALLLALACAAPPAARADDPASPPPHAAAKAGDEEVKKALELMHKHDYKAARAAFEKILASHEDDDLAHGFLAKIAYFYADDALAREHLAKVQNKSRQDQAVEAILDTPFRDDYKDAVAIMQGYSDLRHYYVATDEGFEQSKWDAVKAEYAQLQAAAAKNKKATKGLEDFLKKNRTAGLAECSKALEDIFEQYSALMKFEKDKALCPRVFIFKERADYLAFAQKITGKDEKDSDGLAIGEFHLLLVNAHDAGKKYGVLWRRTRHIIFHEAYHQYMNYWVDNAPSWFNEGMAEVFGDCDTDPKTGRLFLTVLKEPDGAMGMTNYQMVIGGFKPTAVFKPYPIKDFIRLTQDQYYAKDEKDERAHDLHMGLNYAQGWAVCYFLAMGHPKGKGILFNYMKALKEGKPNEEAIGAAFKDYKTDADWAKLDEMFRKYMQSL